jgi:plastocyanin
VGVRRVMIVAAGIVAAVAISAVGAAAGQSATVVQHDFSFSPSTVKITTGSTLVVRNATPSTQHTFTVKGHGIDVHTTGGQTASVVVSLAPGTYPFICTIHVAIGMRGTLVVLASGGSPAPAVSPVPFGAPQTGLGGTSPRPFPLASVAIGSMLLLSGALGIMRRRTLRRE